ncbi:hypothetical protein ACOJCM_05875 [Billgrantia sp. LNSP4103-1]|uniref:hypothetical protein n=1 Tax=Billgrantia sp. LNSP4103-1 TaxID=3410266 RepID=UPI00403FB74F
MHDEALNSTHRPRTWFQRLGGFLFDASMPRLVYEMRREAAPTYQAMVRDFATPMSPAFEREVARSLNRGGEVDLIPSLTLLPPMMARFGLTTKDFDPDDRQALAELQRECDRCPVVGRCWRALRAGADQERCRAFCPNAPAFETREERLQ